MLKKPSGRLRVVMKLTEHLVPLPPKTFAVLRYLVEHAGRLVPKDELTKAVWPDTRISEGVLKGYIRDLRDVLGDNPEVPRFIETVPRRGHRWIEKVVSTQYPVAGSQKPKPTPNPQPLTPNPKLK